MGVRQDISRRRGRGNVGIPPSRTHWEFLSFYNTFKSKKNTYLECLKHYNATVNNRRAEAFMSAPTAAAGIRAFFKAVFDQLDDPGTPSRVCMMAGTLTHEVLIEPDLRKYVQQQKRALNERLSKRFQHDKQARLLPAEFDPERSCSQIREYVPSIPSSKLVSVKDPLDGNSLFPLMCSNRYKTGRSGLESDVKKTRIPMRAGRT